MLKLTDSELDIVMSAAQPLEVHSDRVLPQSERI
jgi:hypothetical protein